MTLGAVVRQGFGFEVPWLPAWHMYRGFGVGLIEVTLTRVTPNGELPVDRLAVLGHTSWRTTPMNVRRIEHPSQLQRQVQQICAALGSEVDLRVRARVARRWGWEVVATGDRDACP